ncbi:capsule assembly Wzi family protein [Emcibacter sp.]|uniref:capsule assembly Wzi family protein n=1 Tax=Emcibacter sp. TaxID=1979954 RepID=UPI003A8D2906
MQLRNDVELLARYELITGPVGTWPMSWKQITRNLYRADEMDLPAYVRSALMRVQQKVPGQWAGKVRLQASTEPEIIRGFDSTARNDLDVSAAVQYNGESTTVNIAGGYRNGNGEDYGHLDGSYIAQELGNWQLYAGAIDRWWGPGREGTLLLSNNARPMPSIGLMRSEPQPFQTKWLSWMGPWQLRLFVAKMEEVRHVPDALIAGISWTFEPIENWEIGLRRTIQLCGDGRPCDAETWAKALIGGGDVDNSGTLEEPGNQLASVDMAYSFGIGKDATLKLYAEGTAEDEAGKLFLPKRFARLLGATAYGPWGEDGAQWRLTGEYTDTTSAEYWLFGQRIENVIYEHTIYHSGYRYKGRSLGHSVESDGKLLSLAATYIDKEGWAYDAKFYHADINRDSSETVLLSLQNQKVNIFELAVSGRLFLGDISVAARYADRSFESFGSDKRKVSVEGSWVFNF